MGIYYENPVIDALIGKKVESVEGNTITLSDGTRLTFEDTASDCCSWQELDSLTKVDNLITGARFTDVPYSDSPYESNYRYTLTVMTEAGEFNLAEAHGNESNGYYLRGWSLNVTIDR